MASPQGISAQAFDTPSDTVRLEPRQRIRCLFLVDLREHDDRQELPQDAWASFRTVESGAASIVWAATAPEVADHNGAYIQNCAIANAAGAPHASDPAVAQRVWDVTESLIAR